MRMSTVHKIVTENLNMKKTLQNWCQKHRVINEKKKDELVCDVKRWTLWKAKQTSKTP